jgi:hypothetical protein
VGKHLGGSAFKEDPECSSCTLGRSEEKVTDSDALKGQASKATGSLFLILFPVLGIKPRVLHMLSKQSITELHLQLFVFSGLSFPWPSLALNL